MVIVELAEVVITHHENIKVNKAKPREDRGTGGNRRGGNNYSRGRY